MALSRIKWIIYPIIFLIAYSIIWTLNFLEVFKSYKINDSSCEHIIGPNGMEDNTVWNEDAVLATQRAPYELLKKPKVDGGMYVISNLKGENKDVKIT